MKFTIKNGKICERTKIGNCDYIFHKILSKQTIVEKLNKQNKLIQEKDKEISRLKKDVYNWYWKSKINIEELQKEIDDIV